MIGFAVRSYHNCASSAKVEYPPSGLILAPTPVCLYATGGATASKRLISLVSEYELLDDVSSSRSSGSSSSVALVMLK